MELKTKINNSKVIAEDLNGTILIKCKSFRMFFHELNVIIQNYMIPVLNTSIDVDASKLNLITKINLFGTAISVNEAFEIYNECIKEFDLNYPIINKQAYDPDNSINFSPSNLG